MFFSFVLVIGLVVIISLVRVSMQTGISPMPSPQKARKVIKNLIPEEFDGTLLELGSGWGGLAFTLARRAPKAHVIGYELSIFPFYVSQLLKFFFQQHNLTFYRKNFYEVSFIRADVLVCYLFPKAMEKVKKKWDGEQKKESRLISYAFALPGAQHHQIERLSSFLSSEVFEYRATSYE